MWAVLKQNLTFGLRTLAKSPGFAVTAVLTLALGIGATTAMFSVVYAVFEPMPYHNPDQLVMVWTKAPGGRQPVPPADFFDWQRRSTSFQAMSAWSGASFNLSSGDGPNKSRAHGELPASSRWKDCRSCTAATSFRKKESPAKVAWSYSVIACGSGSLARIRILSANRSG